MRHFENTITYNTWNPVEFVHMDVAVADDKMAFRGACCDAYVEGDTSENNLRLREACPSCDVVELTDLLWDRSINQCRGTSAGRRDFI